MNAIYEFQIKKYPLFRGKKMQKRIYLIHLNFIKFTLIHNAILVIIQQMTSIFLLNCFEIFCDYLYGYENLTSFISHTSHSKIQLLMLIPWIISYLN